MARAQRHKTSGTCLHVLAFFSFSVLPYIVYVARTWICILAMLRAASNVHRPALGPRFLRANRAKCPLLHVVFFLFPRMRYMVIDLLRCTQCRAASGMALKPWPEHEPLVARFSTRNRVHCKSVKSAQGVFGGRYLGAANAPIGRDAPRLDVALKERIRYNHTLTIRIELDKVSAHSCSRGRWGIGIAWAAAGSLVKSPGVLTILAFTSDARHLPRRGPCQKTRPRRPLSESSTGFFRSTVSSLRHANALLVLFRRYSTFETVCQLKEGNANLKQ